MTDSLNRRSFLQLAGLAGVAGTVGCQVPAQRELISLVMPDEPFVPGIANWYSSTCRECPAGCGIRVRTHEGRANKVEGNPEHPLSQGGLCIRGQAGLQGLYNPDRIPHPLRRRDNGATQAVSWEEAQRIISERLASVIASGERNRIAFLGGRTGASLERLIRQWLEAMRSELYVAYEAFDYRAIQQANGITFGEPRIPAYRIAEADYVVSFGADFLETWLSPVNFSRSYARMREPAAGRAGKMVQVEPRLSLTGANADEWIAIRPGTEVLLALAMTHHILFAGLAARLPADEVRRLELLVQDHSADRVSSSTDIPAATIRRLAEEFAGATSGLALGSGLAGSGENATATHVAVNLLNYVSGRIGQTVRFDSPFSLPDTPPAGTLDSLIAAMDRGDVDVLFLHGSNPVFNLPPGLGIVAAIKKVPLVVSFASFPDETSELAHLILPDHTPLEQWGDFRPAAGVHSLQQPVMNPVFDTRSAGDVLLQLARQAGEQAAPALAAETFADYLKEHWRSIYRSEAGDDFETFWRESLRRGGWWRDAAPGGLDAARRIASPRLSSQVFQFHFGSPAEKPPDRLFLHLYPSSKYFDGRGANKPWLHEIPDPITNVVWDSWVEIHPQTARQLGVVEGDLVRIESSAGQIEAPAYLYEGIRPDTVAIPLGLGHTAYGQYARGRGVNPVALLPAAVDPHADTMVWAGVAVSLARTGRRSPLVRTDGSLTDHGRGFSRIIPLSALTAPSSTTPDESHSPAPPGHALPSLYPEHTHKDYRWGMAIDLNACTGCSACVAACYAENNIPVVGKERIAQGRHMAWIRIERYMEAVSAAPDIRFSPMMCQQCDNAPCEPVCPVYATMHSSDGLNVQVYNRCVGTRYCSNNCPYKVRVFNWFDYPFPEPLHLQLNPDVSAREKGVMEKCTFCIHRIRSARDIAKDEGRLVRDGEVTPACAQSCPTRAIAFGNLLDPDSRVSQLAARQHGYKVLEELNTRPAVTYLPRIKRT